MTTRCKRPLYDCRVPFTVLSHTADTGIEATASTLPGLIQELAMGMWSLIAQPSPCPPDHPIEFEIAALSAPDLVVDALAELLYRAEAAGVVVCEVQVEGSDRSLNATVRADAMAARTVDLLGPPIKGVTYHDLIVREDDDGWYGQVYFDV